MMRAGNDFLCFKILMSDFILNLILYMKITSRSLLYGAPLPLRFRGWSLLLAPASHLVQSLANEITARFRTLINRSSWTWGI